MPQRIFLLGAYGQGNIGDEAILEVFLGELKNWHFSVASSNPEKTEEIYKVPALDTYGNYKKMLTFLLNSNVIIFGGGSLLKELDPHVTRRWRYSLLFHLLIGLFLAKLLRRKVVFSAIGVGPLNGPISKILAKLCLMFVDLVIVRDEVSSTLLCELGFRYSILGADPALLLVTDEEIAEKKGIENTLKVGICPVFFVDEKNTWQSLVETFAEFADYLTENLEAEVTLLPFQSEHNLFNDLELNKDILGQIRNKSKANLLEKVANPRQMLKSIASLDLIVGARLHSLIFSFLEKKPFLAITCDEKVRNFIGDTGLKRYSVEASELNTEKLEVRFEEVVKDKERIVSHIENTLPVMVKRAKLNFKCLRQLLECEEPRRVP